MNVYDIECTDWIRPYLACAITRDGENHVFRGDDCVSRLFDLMARVKGEWYAHAGGIYDALFVLDLVRESKIEVAMQGSRVLRATIGRGKEAISLVDSWGILPLPLAKVGEIVGIPKLEMPTSYSRPSDEREWESAIEYCLRDCDVLRHGLRWVDEELGREGWKRKATIGATAWSAAKAIGAPSADGRPFGEWRMSRTAYYGGRCEVARVRAESVYSYDINSAYPWALTSPVPFRAKMKDANDAISSFENDDEEGAYFAVVRVPESVAPPLPVRVRDRLFFPYGRFSGAWTKIELKNALSKGAKIDRIMAACAGKTSDVLRPFVERCWAKREVAKSRAESTWWKLLANSLSGKLAQRDEIATLEFAPIEDVILGEEDSIVAHRPDGVWVARTKHRVPSSGWPEAAATLTARARIRLLDGIDSVGPDWCYSDTDSIIATSTIDGSLIGDSLGSFKFEGSHSPYYAAAPKIYRMGEKARAKGIPRADIDVIDRVIRGERVEWDAGIARAKSAIRADSMVMASRGRRAIRPVDGWVGGRIGPDRYGRTRAPSIAEARSRPR